MWDIIETPTGDLTHKDIIAIYDNLSCSVIERNREIADKIKNKYELAKHDTYNGIKTWETEGGAVPEPVKE